MGGTETDTGDTGAQPIDESAALFDPVQFPTFELHIPPASWDGLRLSASEYQPATFRYGDEELASVGVRLKGVASFQDIDGDKPAFKVKFNHYLPNQTFKGLRRLTLNNMVQDGSKIDERLGYYLLREAGLVAPRCNSARLIVNGVYYGVYANLESLDRIFVDRHYQDTPGNLYDIRDRFVDLSPGREGDYELETNETVNDTSDLTALIAAVNGPMATFVEDTEGVLDLDEVLKLGAVQAIMADWDGYFGSSNNYKLYHELDRDRFVMFPWGIDQTFQGLENYDKPDYDIDHRDAPQSRGIIFSRCMCRSDCADRYRQAVAQALAVFESLDLKTVLMTYAAQIRSALQEEEAAQRGGMSIEDIEEAQMTRIDFIRARPAFVRQGLQQPVMPDQRYCSG